MQVEPAVLGPVVHRLEGDQGEVAVDRELGHLVVLDAVRPAPQHLPGAELGQVFGLWLGQQYDVGPGDQLFPVEDACDRLGQLEIGDPELFAVPGLEEDALPQVLVDPLEMAGMDRQSMLVLFAGTADDAES